MCEPRKKYKQQDISSGYIKCNDCNELKTLENYFFNNVNEYYDYRCKDCKKKEYLKKRGPYKKSILKTEVNENGQKVCTNCGVERDISEFLKVKGKYHSHVCNKCLYLRKKNKIALTEDQKLFNEGLKKCRVCNEILPFEKFRVKNPKELRTTTCSSCLIKRKTVNPKYIEYQRNWRKSESGKLSIKKSQQLKEQKVKEKRQQKKLERLKQKEIKKQELLTIRELKQKEREIKLQEKNQKKLEWEKLQEYYKTDEWKEIKKQKERESSYKRWKRRWNNNELFAMKVRIRNLIRNTFRKSGHTKPEKRTEQILGCGYEELKSHLESKFVEGMSWDNRGEWHIDHIIPLSSASTKEQLIELSHYSNLQPLWEKDNLRKSNNIL